MSTKTIYFDESGFTGYNLLDPLQPVFAIASSDIDDAVAETILCASFPKYRGSEYKLSNIWRSNSRLGLIEFARQIAIFNDHILIWAMDKKYVVLTKIVDFLIEPIMTRCGYDFYADGFCWKYTNYIHYGLKKFSHPDLLDRLLECWQSFSRAPTETSLRLLQTYLRIMANSVEEEVKVFLDQMAMGAEMFHEFHDLPTFGGSDELQVTSMQASVVHWRQRHTEDFHVVHDASSNFFRNRDLWERMTNKDVPKQEMPLGDGTTVEYPLRVLSTTPMDSKGSRAIQLCDIIAGLGARVLRDDLDGNDQKFLDEVLLAGFDKITYNGTRPATIFPNQIPPRRLTGPDVVDKLSAIIFGPHNAARAR